MTTKTAHDSATAEPVTASADIHRRQTMAQIMVVVNGLLLSVVAFGLFSFLLGNAVVKYNDRLVAQVLMAIDMRFDETLTRAERLLDTLSDRLTAPVRGNLLLQTMDPFEDDFAGFALFDSSLHTTGEAFHPISMRGLSSPFWSALKQELNKRPEFTQRAGITVIRFPSTLTARQKVADPDWENIDFIIIIRSSDEKQRLYTLIALVNGDTIYNDEFFKSYPDVRSLALSSLDQEGDPVVITARGSASSLPDSTQQHVSENWIALGSGKWRVVIGLNPDHDFKWLHHVPYILLIFGLMFTAVGAFFVRSNQHQALKLSSMNRVLAQKNMDLNSEITERERLNLALRKAERENRAIINSVSDIIFETDTMGKILFVNDSWVRITGLESDAALERNLFDMLHPQDQGEQTRDFQMLVKGKKTAYRALTRLRTSTGSYRSVELAFSMLRNDENKQLRVVGTITDIEERLRAEQAQIEAERKFRTIWENAASGIYQMTVDGQILSANPAMVSLFGFTSAETMMRDVLNAHKQLYADTQERQVILRRLIAEGAINTTELQAMRADGSRFWIQENARAVRDDTGNILYFEGSIDDITVRKQSDIALREAKMQSDLANRAKSEFLANMSHELRTPLNAIIGFSEIMRSETYGALPTPQYKEYVQDIHSSGKHLLTLINDLLDISKIDAGERELNESRVDIARIISVCVDMMGPKAMEQSLTLAVDIAPHLPHLIAEELAVKQILVNLLSNAIKFTASGGSIHLFAERAISGEIVITVADTGVGLDDDEIKRIMVPFGQANSSFSRTEQGAGLGLTLSIGLMRLHGGRIDITSEKGKGTRVSMVFPAQRAAS